MSEENPAVTYFPLVQQSLQALYSLSPVERAVLNMRFGLDDGLERDREEVAQHYGVSVEIIHSLEMEALRKLRNPERYCQNGRAKRGTARGAGKATPHLYLVQ